MFQLHPLHHKPRLAPNFLCTSALVCSTAKEMENAEQHLTRWERAGLIDANTAAAIRGFEATRTKQGGRQWMVLLVLILGGILLGAGVLLFVAAHWAELSPLSRMFLVLAMLVFFHGMGLLVRGRFDALATAMHAVGTVSAGAAIALVGQIFNMQEHWPAAILLWAICAAAGWLLLRDQFQQTLTLLLVPAWIVSEWSSRSDPYAGLQVHIARMLAVIGIVYLTAFLHSRKRIVFGILFAAGAILSITSVVVLSDGWNRAFFTHASFVPVSYRLTALAILLLAILFGALADRRSIAPACVVAIIAYALPWAQNRVTEQFNTQWQRTEPNLLAYAMVAAAAIFLVWWGVRTLAKALVNYGMAAFAATVVWFYFSSVMDKLGGSLGLITLGVLFLAGGWLLERTRRRLVGGIAEGAA
jgi:uncharacterized membrane protein